MVLSKEAYDFREEKGRGSNRLFTKPFFFFIIAFPFVLGRTIKTGLFCFVVIHFLKSQGLPFACFD